AKRTRAWRGWSSLAASVVVLGVLGWFASPLRYAAGTTYVTQLGEQRTFRLPDGSVLYLNTQSRATVSYSNIARDVQLEQGEALFAVAAESRRPFRVHTGTAVVQAIGTQFNVYRNLDATTVSVIEGRVKVSPADEARDVSGSSEEATSPPATREDTL